MTRYLRNQTPKKIQRDTLSIYFNGVKSLGVDHPIGIRELSEASAGKPLFELPYWLRFFALEEKRGDRK